MYICVVFEYLQLEMVTQEKKNLLEEIKQLKFEIKDMKMSLDMHTQITKVFLKQRNWYKSKIASLRHAVEELQTNCQKERTRADMLAEQLSMVCYECLLPCNLCISNCLIIIDNLIIIGRPIPNISC